MVRLMTTCVATVGRAEVSNGYTGTDKYIPAGVVHKGEGLMPGSYFGLPGIVHFTGSPTLENIDGHWPTWEAWQEALDDNE